MSIVTVNSITELVKLVRKTNTEEFVAIGLKWWNSLEDKTRAYLLAEELIQAYNNEFGLYHEMSLKMKKLRSEIKFNDTKNVFHFYNLINIYYAKVGDPQAII